MQHRTSLTDHTSGCSISASAGDFLMSRNRHVAAFLRTMDLTAPFVCRHGTLREACAHGITSANGHQNLCAEVLYPVHGPREVHVKPLYSHADVRMLSPANS